MEGVGKRGIGEGRCGERCWGRCRKGCWDVGVVKGDVGDI